MKKTILIFLLLKLSLSFGQSKKKQIETLQMRTDSLIDVLTKERDMNAARFQEQININELAQNQIDSLRSELRTLNNVYNQTEIEKSQFRDDLRQMVAEANKLKNNLTELKDSLQIITAETAQIRKKLQNVYLGIPEDNFDYLVTKLMNKDKNTSDYTNWILKILPKDTDGDVTYVTETCLDYISDVIDNSSGYDESLDTGTLIKKWANKYDLKYATFGHLFETGTCGWASRKLISIDFLGELNSGNWFKLTLKGGCGVNDYSETIIRVIKVIKKGNAFYIDNFLSLTEE